MTKWQGTGSLWCKMAFSCVLPRGHRCCLVSCNIHPFYFIPTGMDGCSCLCHFSFVICSQSLS